MTSSPTSPHGLSGSGRTVASTGTYLRRSGTVTHPTVQRTPLKERLNPAPPTHSDSSLWLAPTSSVLCSCQLAASCMESTSTSSTGRSRRRLLRLRKNPTATATALSMVFRRRCPPSESFHLRSITLQRETGDRTPGRTRRTRLAPPTDRTGLTFVWVRTLGVSHTCAETVRAASAPPPISRATSCVEWEPVSKSTMPSSTLRLTWPRTWASLAGKYTLSRPMCTP
mmetsp:Transcript_18693/g.29137  ORF Transcript_18693/g.29137 Transcript_18693/m.29137 type:complete len:226 (-) Transcript_18693:1853-2530(-)